MDEKRKLEEKLEQAGGGGGGSGSGALASGGKSSLRAT